MSDLVAYELACVAAALLVFILSMLKYRQYQRLHAASGGWVDDTRSGTFRVLHPMDENPLDGDVESPVEEETDPVELHLEVRKNDNTTTDALMESLEEVLREEEAVEEQGRVITADAAE